MIEAELKKRQRFIDMANEFGSLLKEQKITMTSASLAGFFNGGVRYMEEMLIVETMKALKFKSGAVSDIMKQGFVDSAHQIAGKFGNMHYTLQAFEGLGVPVENITVQKGKAVITDEEKDEITERYTHRLSEADQELFDRIEKFLDLLHEEDRFLNEAIGVSLKRILEWDDFGSSTPSDARLRALRFRDDLPIVKHENRFIVNPAWFGKRAIEIT